MEEATMIKAMFIGAFLLTGLFAEDMEDTDFDGVPDSIDECPNTPFLNEVNERGCTSAILRLPDETDFDTMTLTLASGFETNEDLPGKEEQRKTKMQLNYFHNDWSFSVLGAYFTHNHDSGTTDTTIKVRKRFRITPDLRVNIGAGVKLPTYDFVGNRTDFKLYSSFYYYPTYNTSVYGGVNYTFIRDTEEMGALRNKTNAFVGAGYFFTPELYASLGYSYEESKFVSEYAYHFLSVTLFYQVTDHWFTTIFYKEDVVDEDLHNEFYFKLGYKFW